MTQSRMEQEAAVRCFYDNEIAEEDQRLDAYPFEFAVTMRFVAKYLGNGAQILDVACGTGRYAEALLAAGFRVVLTVAAPLVVCRQTNQPHKQSRAIPRSLLPHRTRDACR